MVLEIDLIEKVLDFLSSQEGVACFMVQNNVERSSISDIIRPNHTYDEPFLYKEEDLEGKTAFKKNGEGAVWLETTEAPELIEAYAFLGRKGAFAALNEAFSFGSSLYPCAALALIEDQDFKFQCQMTVKKHLTGVTKGMHALHTACSIGQSLDKIHKKENELLGANLDFRNKIEPLLFKIYKLMFTSKPATSKSLQTILLEQNKLREEVEAFSEQTRNKALNLTTEGPLMLVFRNRPIAITEIVAILNRQNLEAKAYVRLSKLYDAQLTTSEYKFLKSRFRRMGLMLTDQAIRCSLVLGIEIAKGNFAFLFHLVSKGL